MPPRGHRPGWRLTSRLCSGRSAGTDTGIDLGDMPDSTSVLHTMYERVDENGAPLLPDPSAQDHADRYRQVRGSEGRVIATLDLRQRGPARRRRSCSGR